jgi:hypothetical protein
MNSRSISKKVAYSVLITVLWYGLWMLFQVIHGEKIVPVPPLIWWLPLLIMIPARFFWPSKWERGLRFKKG